ncbi:MAG: hypothetical protein EOS55_10565 [Mesorhizobium sp.]|nr:MAG: hypothetical protein EOS55_10565 [Mesorhizobium sp.]
MPNHLAGLDVDGAQFVVRRRRDARPSRYSFCRNEKRLATVAVARSGHHAQVCGALEALDNPAWRDSDKRLGWPGKPAQTFRSHMRFEPMLCTFDEAGRAGILRPKGGDHVL